MSKVVWIPLPHYQGHEVSSAGEIRNSASGNILRTSVNQWGVRYVSIRNTTMGKYENKAVGTIVAAAFLGDPTQDAETVLHLDGNPDNNSATNLMWATRWHAMAYHKEIVSGQQNPRIRVSDENGTIYRNVVDAAMRTGCLPSGIEYAMRYNAALAKDEHINFAHRTYPGGHIFRQV